MPDSGGRAAVQRIVAPDLPAFRERFPWIGGDLQTLRHTVRRAFGARPERFPGIARRPEIVSLSDGDALLVDRMVPARAHPDAPEVVLIHGLTGCQDSGYVCRSAHFWLERGHRVTRLNLRGAGPGRPLARGHYHAGRSADLADAFAHLGQDAPTGLIAVGYSLGGNTLLKHLGEVGSDTPLRAAIAVSAPLILREAQERLMRPRNALYQRYLLRRMKAETLAPEAGLPDAMREAGQAARTVLAFDDVVVAPANGFSGALDYYRQSSAADFLSKIKVPSLVIHAGDDPWIPAKSIRGLAWTDSPRVASLFPDGGGHVGFHGRGLAHPWHDEAAGRFWAASARGPISS